MSPRFSLTFIIPRSCSARLLVKGTSKSVRKRKVSVWKVFRAVGNGGEAESDRRPIELEKGLEFSGRERRSARLSRFVNRSSCASLPTQATMLAEQISGASKRSLRAWAASSGRSCWTMR